MAEKKKTMNVNFTKTFVLDKKNVGPKDTKNGPKTLPISQAKYLIACGLVEEAKKAAN